ncbi:metallopeptidase family protein [Roseibium limicola]|uniref:Metallopeptidase family protein n=1 Tax=Roseibium limicola TaxID=2816037 RepID=A0A939EQK4_9HYPH|nr:metallopeptidase family protein [Roseibium limicola]MBO0346767.1 metallopeptidase family protein [Roseibium limicola]
MASIHPPRSNAWADRRAPDLAAFEAMASETLAQLPHEFLSRCGQLQVTLADFAPDDLLDAMGIEDPYELLGIFEGSPFTEEVSSLVSSQMPNRIWLFRRAIVDYWAGGDESLGEVVAHVLIHEIGHHFGLSDQDMERIEAAVER